MTDQLAEHGYENLRYVAEGLHPVALALCLIGLVLIWTLPRQYVVSVFLFQGVLIPFTQQVVVAGLHLFLVRFLIAAAVLRIIARQEYKAFRLGTFDKVFLAYVVVLSAVFILQWRSFDAIVNRGGFAYNALGLYWIVRVSLRDTDDLRQALRSLFLLVVLVAVCMSIEWRTGRNFFSVLGGVPPVTELREDRLRCQAAFAHPILAGAFGATAFPLLLGLWLGNQAKRRWMALWSSFAAAVIVWTCASSGPLMSAFGGIAAVLLWRYRDRVGRLRAAGVWVLIVLHLLVMKASVWALIWRGSALAGSSGYHRYALVDNCITHLGEWWLLGMRSTDHWEGDAQMWDVANQFVATAINGGIWAFALMIALLAVAFSAIGRLVRDESLPLGERFLIWCVGASLFAHCVGFVGICYFDQMQVVWYGLLGAVGTLCARAEALRKEHKERPYMWFKPAVYAVLVMLAARITAHDSRLFF